MVDVDLLDANGTATPTLNDQPKHLGVVPRREEPTDMAEDDEEPGLSKYNPRTDLRDFANYPLQRTIHVSDHSCAAVSFRKDGLQIATACGIPEHAIQANAPVKIWDVETGQEVMSFKGHTQGVSDVCWTQEAHLLASASDDSTVRVWDVKSGRCIHTLTGHTHDVTSCSFTATGNLLASGSVDETIRYWDVQNGRCVRVTPGHSDPVVYVDFFQTEHQNPLLVSASLDGICRVWNPLMGSCFRSLINSTNLPLSFATFTPNTRFVLLGMLGGRMELWDYKERVRKKVYRGHRNKYYCLKAAFLLNDPIQKSEDARSGFVVCGSEDHHVYLWHLNRPDKLGPQVLRGRPTPNAPGEGHCGVVLSVDTSTYHPVIASSGAEPDGTVKLWKAEEKG